VTPKGSLILGGDGGEDNGDDSGSGSGYHNGEGGIDSGGGTSDGKMVEGVMPIGWQLQC
jgi:hypothetical protein